MKIQECRDKVSECEQEGNFDAADRYEMAARAMARGDFLGAEVWLDKANEKLAEKRELVAALEEV